MGNLSTIASGLFGLFGLAALAAAALLASFGDTRGAGASTFLAVGAFVLMGPRAEPVAASPRRAWLATAFVAGAIAVLAAPLAVAGVFAALFVVKWLLNLQLVRR